MPKLELRSSLEEDYSRRVDSESVKPLARKILSDVNNRGVADCWGAAALHEYVLENVEYDEEVGPNFNREPKVAARKGGNCVDLSILLASLYRCINLTCRLTVVRSTGNEGHMFPEVFFQVSDIEQVTESLKEFYSEPNTLRLFRWNFSRDDDRKGFWMVSDPTGSSYVGDIQGLVQGGLVKNADGGTGFQVLDRLPVD